MVFFPALSSPTRDVVPGPTTGPAATVSVPLSLGYGPSVPVMSLNYSLHLAAEVVQFCLARKRQSVSFPSATEIPEGSAASTRTPAALTQAPSCLRKRQQGFPRLRSPLHLHPPPSSPPPPRQRNCRETTNPLLVAGRVVACGFRPRIDMNQRAGLHPGCIHDRWHHAFNWLSLPLSARYLPTPSSSSSSFISSSSPPSSSSFT